LRLGSLTDQLAIAIAAATGTPMSASPPASATRFRRKLVRALDKRSNGVSWRRSVIIGSYATD
jgi:hypothetical protein